MVFDTKEPTFRHVMYDQYKANRDAFPEDLVPQLGRIKTLIGLMGIPMLELPGYEADDIVGTIAKRESDAGHDVLCVTSDKDYFQLVNNKVRILRPGKDVGQYDVYDAEAVKNKFGVYPEHVIDVLALIGDSSDNVPGVKGVGEKTAIPLIEQYQTIENIYANLDAIEKASLKTKLEASREMAALSKILVTIHTDVPLEATREMMLRKATDYTGIDAFCEELGFGTLRRKFATAGGLNIAAGEIPALATATPTITTPTLRTLATTEHRYTLVDTPGGLQELVDALTAFSAKPPAQTEDAPWLSVDLETTGLDAMQCGIVGVAISIAPTTAWYIDVYDTAQAPAQDLFSETADPHGIPVQDVMEAMKPFLTNPAVHKVGQNLKFDALILKRYGIDVTPIGFDSMLASFILNPDMQHGLDPLSERWLQYQPISITTLIGEKKATQKSMRDVNVADVAEYAGEDADIALQLCIRLKSELDKEGLTKVATEIEFPVAEVCLAMEYNGIYINTGALGDLGSFMRSEASRLEKEIYAEANMEFTIASPKQLGEVLFEKLMLPAGKKTKTGYSTDSSVLTELAETFPIAQMVLDYRQVEKLRSTYVESLPKLIHPITGRVHTTYNQTVAATGRLSSTDPNLQNIPIRTELGQQIRKAFVAQDPDSVILSLDYSQIELRIMAAIARDPGLLDAFSKGQDVHAATAATLFDTTIDAVTSDHRRVAKTVNFGIMYGLGAFGLAQRLGISRTEGSAIIANYFEKYPGIKKYIDTTIEKTRELGYVTTMMGRRRYFPLIHSNNRGLRTGAERACINTPIQGSAADMIKLAMINVHKRMQREGFKSLLMLQVHDELVFEAKKSELEVLTKAVKEEMENAMPLQDVPVLVESGFGTSWYEAH